MFRKFVFILQILAVSVFLSCSNDTVSPVNTVDVVYRCNAIGNGGVQCQVPTTAKYTRCYLHNPW